MALCTFKCGAMQLASASDVLPYVVNSQDWQYSHTCAVAESTINTVLLASIPSL